MRIGGGQDRPNLVDEEELQLSDFNVTDEEDEDLFTTNVPLKKNYLDNWWEKFVGVEQHADNEDLLSLDGSHDEGTIPRYIHMWEMVDQWYLLCTGLCCNIHA